MSTENIDSNELFKPATDPIRKYLKDHPSYPILREVASNGQPVKLPLDAETSRELDKLQRKASEQGRNTSAFYGFITKINAANIKRELPLRGQL